MKIDLRQAGHGTWQLWSCVRHTREGGKTRLLHHWEGAKLTDANWKPLGIAMRADARFGETPGGLQAPFVFRDKDRFWMFYGDWVNICSATSADGKTFKRRRTASRKVGLFSEGDDANARDPMLLRIGDTWHCYYAAHPQRKGAVYCRTSNDLTTWSTSHIVAKGGRTGDGPSSAECPFVVEREPGQFYLFRTQRYGKDAQTSVYFSHDPLGFGVDNDEGHFIGTLPVGAPEIFRHDDGWFIAALMPSIKGIQIARLEWAR